MRFVSYLHLKGLNAFDIHVHCIRYHTYGINNSIALNVMIAKNSHIIHAEMNPPHEQRVLIREKAGRIVPPYVKPCCTLAHAKKQ